MEIPIYIDGERTGTLVMSSGGGAALFDARLRDPGRVVRLRVFGEREEWYLGVPEPEGDGLRLVRRLSPSRLRGFPGDPLYVSESRLEGEPVPARDPSPAEERRRVIWLGGRPHYF